jgi:DNA-binding IclR family transcriptional regulator
MADKTKTVERQQRETEECLAVLDAILDHHALSLKSIVQRTGLGLHVVRRHVVWLDENGYIVKLRPSGHISMVTRRGKEALAARQFTTRPTNGGKKVA